MPQQEVVRNPLSRVLWWLLFAAATVLMSLWFQTFKSFTLEPSLGNGLIWLGVMLTLVAVVAVLVYDSYIQEKCRGNLQRTIRFFEWLEDRQFLIRHSLRKGEHS